MTEQIRNPHVRELCRLAVADESALQYPLPDHLFGFAAQQSCEKLLKALISSHDYRYPFIHPLERLSRIASELGESVPVSAELIAKLRPFAVELRYQSEDRLGEGDRAFLRDAIVPVREYVLGRIAVLETES